MKRETETLIGQPLNYAVALAQGAVVSSDGHGKCWLINGALLGYLKSYNPSDDWEQAGEIIVQEKIDLIHHHVNNTVTAVVWFKGQNYKTSHSALVSAMRAFVYSRFGAEVTFPEGLL